MDWPARPSLPLVGSPQDAGEILVEQVAAGGAVLEILGVVGQVSAEMVLHVTVQEQDIGGGPIVVRAAEAGDRVADAQVHEVPVVEKNQPVVFGEIHQLSPGPVAFRKRLLQKGRNRSRTAVYAIPRVGV